MKYLPALLMLTLTSCGEDSKQIVSSFNTPPSLRIEEPLEGIGVSQYDEVLFVVYVEDNQDDAENLKVTWSSDIQPDFFGPEKSDEDGYILYPTTSLIGGYHTILITVTDSEGLTAAASVQVDVEALAAIQLVSPEEEAYGRIDEETEFSVIVRDGVDSIEALQIDFSSTHPSILGSFCTPILDTAANTASCSIALPEGLHNLTFSSTNSSEETVSVSRDFQVYSPLQIDDDGDGFCEEPPCINVENILIEDDTASSEGYYLFDCDDTDILIFENAPEVANNVDDDCDGIADDGTTKFDDDGDGYCETPPCYGSITELASDSDGINDCDDEEPTIYLGAEELINDIDDNCDGLIDDGTTAYDDDGDGQTEADGDCNDANILIFFGAEEIANFIDDDCDGIIDEGTANYDDDGDGLSENQGDCDDAINTIYTGAPELVNGVDDNCNGIIDDGTVAYDDDGDGQTENQGDCNDNNISIYLGANEVANNIDDDCDNTIDEGTEYYDNDGDGYCTSPPCSGSIANLANDSSSHNDCDDNNSQRFPTSPELCSTSFDDNCNNDTNDIGASGCTTFYFDGDGDGYAISDAQCSCEPIGSFTVSDSSKVNDCYDSNPNVNIAQQGTFTSDRGDGSFDYNCNGLNDKKFTTSAKCEYDTSLDDACKVKRQGWEGSVASCGVQADYVDNDDDKCVYELGSCIDSSVCLFGVCAPNATHDSCCVVSSSMKEQQECN